MNEKRLKIIKVAKISINIIIVLSLLLSVFCPNVFAADTVTIAEISGVNAPVTGATPVTAIIPTSQYIGTVTWDPADNPFVGGTVYTATITLDAEPGYTFTNVTENFFTVARATTVTNAADSGVVTAVFPATATEITIAEIPGVTVPVTGGTPVSVITETAQYTGTATWDPADNPFVGATVYTATITLSAKPGFTFDGVDANFFTVSGASATNAADSGVVTAVFPATQPAVITIAVIPGVTVPVVGGTPDTAITGTAQYTGTISWNPTDNPYHGGVGYTATITLSAKPGFTFTGVSANFFTVSGASSVTNPAGSGVVTAVFPTTATTVAIINISAIPGVTVPVRAGTPVSVITETTQYNGTVTWTPAVSHFAESTVYTATINLTAKAGFTFNGVAANFFTVAGATTVTNAANSSIVTAVFPATAAPPSSPPSSDVPTANPGGPYTGSVGTSIQFNGSKSSADSGRTISSYSWIFGDGTTSTGVQPTHIYINPGTYNVQLTVTDSTGATDTASTTATISAGPPPQPTVTASNQTIQQINNAYGITLQTQFFAGDTNSDGLPDVFTDPNGILTPVHFANISGHACFLLSTNTDSIPEFFWDTTTDTMTPLTHIQAQLTTPFIDTTAKTVIIEITVNKTGWIYLDITDKYPIEEYPGYTLTVKAGNRTISSDMIWRKDEKVYILDDPATNYDLIYGFTILPPTFYPVNGTTITNARPTITITYPQELSILVASMDTTNVLNQFITTDKKTFTYTPSTDLSVGTHTLSLTVQDNEENTLTSSSTYTISLPTTQSIPLVPLTIIIIIMVVILIIGLILYLRNNGYF